MSAAAETGRVRTGGGDGSARHTGEGLPGAGGSDGTGAGGDDGGASRTPDRLPAAGTGGVRTAARAAADGADGSSATTDGAVRALGGAAANAGSPDGAAAPVDRRRGRPA
ncbi:MAG: hypothetical protein OXH96_05970 [Spirochaetaceae bacterium]|nr:hypothetical protein [Spirochaetaceae bacterium]